MNARPCDGQPNRMCPSDCEVDCDFQNATLDRAMNAPIASTAEKAEPEENHPWDWIEDLRFWLWFAVFLLSAAAFIGLAVGMAWGLITTGTYRYFF